MTDLLYQANNLSKIYGPPVAPIRALDQVSFNIEVGAFLAILGRSGSGKSTLLNLLGFLDQPSMGTLSFCGTSMGNLDHRQLAKIRNQAIGFIFQSFQLLPKTSALENVELPLLYNNIPRKERKARAIEALERVGLRERLEHMPFELSGGEQQRVAIARAIINQPKVLLADEPTGALDSTTSKGVMELLGELNKQGTSIIVITHTNEVASAARSHLYLTDGKLLSGSHNVN